MYAPPAALAPAEVLQGRQDGSSGRAPNRYPFLLAYSDSFNRGVRQSVMLPSVPGLAASLDPLHAIVLLSIDVLLLSHSTRVATRFPKPLPWLFQLVKRLALPA